MDKKYLIGFACGGLIGWAGKVIFDRNKAAKKTVEIEETTVDLKQCDPEFQDFVKRTYAKKYPDTIEGSIQFARDVGVPEEKILHNLEEVDEFFLGDEPE